MKANSIALAASSTSSEGGTINDRTSSGAWLTLMLLTLVYVFNIADRFVLSTLIDPIKHEFQLSDSAVGFLTGTSLAIFYVLAGLPLGALADRVNRARMVAISVGVWSVMTALCGLTANFWQLLGARIGVGVGEAGGTPPSHSIISDRFPARSRSLALSIWGLGASIGAWLGASGAGYLNEVYGWRTTLIVFGLCGIPVALIVWLFVREPKRGGNDDKAALAQTDGHTLKDCLVHSWHNKAVMHVMLGAMMLTFWGWGIVWWTPSYLVRSFEMTVGDAGALLGPIHGIAGTAVMLLTVAAMYIYRNKPLAAQPRFVGWTTILGSIFSVAAYWLTDIAAVTLALWVFIPIIYIYIGPTSGLIQNLFPPAMRGKGIAMLLFLANIANLAIAPQLIGLLSDLLAPHLANPQESLKYVLLACTSTGFIAAFHYYAAARHISNREDAV